MANGVSLALNLKLQQTLVFDYPSVASMSQYLYSLLEQPGLLETAKALRSAAQTLSPLSSTDVVDIIKVR